MPPPAHPDGGAPRPRLRPPQPPPAHGRARQGAGGRLGRPLLVGVARVEPHAARAPHLADVRRMAAREPGSVARMTDLAPDLWLSTERLVLRPHRPVDLDESAAMWGDPEVTR